MSNSYRVTAMSAAPPETVFAVLLRGSTWPQWSPTAAGGTAIVWSGEFTPLLRGTGWFWRLFLGRFMQRMATGLAAYAERGR